MARASKFREATCLGCGCTDSRACKGPDGDPCGWIKVSYPLAVGVCTSCPEKVEVFDRQLALAEARR
ncbi:hypothetical protein sos41_31640 [Alphaproteobacteria bacterium SO-S41]|nr:hypothetical protein sos41_31640 [Alphaproteobacteria bacterium SO-S41]